MKGRSSARPAGRVRSVNASGGKGVPKRPVPAGRLIAGWGLAGDAHAGPGRKQVSLLAWERALEMRARGAGVECGSFGENITTEGIDLGRLRVGDRLLVGSGPVLEVLEIGKSCPRPCGIARAVGFCIMPEEGVFCSVVEGGPVRAGDPIRPAGGERRR
ncbi:MAG: MOSC domain-containing protein [bacterium]|nr:MOSC domain-containing protein [bacterium]